MGGSHRILYTAEGEPAGIVAVKGALFSDTDNANAHNETAQPDRSDALPDLDPPLET